MTDAPATIAPRDLDRLRRSMAGEVLLPTDAGYDESRRMWNAVHDRRPALIVRPTTPDAVATTVRFAQDLDLDLAVKSGGHSPAGHSAVEGGLVLDLSSMRGVTVDPETRLARANGGALLGELDVAGQAYGLVCPIGVIGHTGVAGLTLGGGVGRLQRQFGLTIDNLVAVELVTAEGRHVRVSETEEPELFWGIRGAGWNFGVVTAFEFRLRPFGPTLHRGLRVYRARDARAVWSIFRDYALTAPDAVSLIFGIDRAGTTLDDAGASPGEPIVYVSYNHSGRAEDVERDTAALRVGPRPLSESAAGAAYLEVQTAHDLVLGHGRRSYIKSANGTGLRPEALDELVDLVASAPGEGTFSVTALGGAIARVPEDATAFTGREAPFDLSADTTWDDPALDEANRAWGRRVMAVVEPDTTLGRYPNGNADAGPDETRLLYGDAKVSRLADLKRIWDPHNVFQRNHNVAPVRPSPA